MDPMDARGRTVLIVESDVEERERLGLALERAGFDVVQCTGPTSPEYRCVGGRDGRCALLGSADIVVLDLWLESDTVMMGTPSHELLRLYLGEGRPVITLGSIDRMNHGFGGEPVFHLDRMPVAEELVRVVQTVARTLPSRANE